LSVMLSMSILLASSSTLASQFMPLSRSPRKDIRWGWQRSEQSGGGISIGILPTEKVFVGWY
jgi:hypothetical protein